MVTIKLSKGYVCTIDDRDIDLVSGYRWCVNICGGSSPRPYALGTPGSVRMNRLIMGLEKGDRRVVDHINGDTLDNRRSNLRICTTKQNSHNSRSFRNAASSYKGVQKASNSDRWRATIWVDGSKLNLGTFDSEQQAALAYNTAAVKHHGRFARINRVFTDAAG